MWISNELGIASFTHGALTLEVDGRGGAHGIHLRTVNRSLGDAPLSTSRIESVDRDTLPAAVDQFIRGDEWHLSLPQESGSYSLELVLRPILETPSENDPPFVALEVTLAIHTSLLDAHPMLDLVVVTSGTRSARAIGIEPLSRSSGCAAVTLGQLGSVLLGPHDYPFTSDQSGDSEIRLRLFGEFLEKGVIRKARPWIVLGAASDETTQILWDQLCEAPLSLS